jgi:hypothetical protein
VVVLGSLMFVDHYAAELVFFIGEQAIRMGLDTVT